MARLCTAMHLFLNSGEASVFADILLGLERHSRKIPHLVTLV